MKSGSTLDARTRRAEREGFEPSIRVSTYAGLANRCLQPLGHLSGRVSEVRDAERLRQPFQHARVRELQLKTTCGVLSAGRLMAASDKLAKFFPHVHQLGERIVGG
jgi:hypothetical protein